MYSYLKSKNYIIIIKDLKVSIIYSEKNIFRTITISFLINYNKERREKEIR